MQQQEETKQVNQPAPLNRTGTGWFSKLFTIRERRIPSTKICPCSSSKQKSLNEQKNLNIAPDTGHMRFNPKARMPSFVDVLEASTSLVFWNPASNNNYGQISRFEPTIDENSISSTECLSSTDAADIGPRDLTADRVCSETLLKKRRKLSHSLQLVSRAPELFLILLSPTLLRRIRRLAVWITIIGIINYRYWTGRIRVPLSCNLFGLQCPSWPISGTVAEGYEPLVNAFKQNFEEGLEIGSSFAAYVGGEPVVELYGGFHDTRFQQPYSNDSLQLIFSSSKVLESIVVTYMVDQGYLDFEQKISSYWPEFGQGNKENVTLSCLLGHRAGVTYLNRAPSLRQLSNLDEMAELLAAQPHNFNGEVVQGYHAVTRGWYLNEIVRRTDPKRRTMGQIIRDDFMPLLGVEYYIGIPPEHEKRISPLIGYPTLRMIARILTPKKYRKEPLPGNMMAVLNRKSVSFKALASQPKQIRPLPYSHNRKEIWRTENPSYNGITNAASLAKFAAVMAGNGTLRSSRLLSQEIVARASQPLPFLSDTVVTRNVTFAVGGFGIQISFPGSEHVKWSGWGGIGGSMVFWNTEKNIAFSYVMNSMTLSGLGDRRSWRLISKLIHCVEAIERQQQQQKGVTR